MTKTGKCNSFPVFFLLEIIQERSNLCRDSPRGDFMTTGQLYDVLKLSISIDLSFSMKIREEFKNPQEKALRVLQEFYKSSLEYMYRVQRTQETFRLYGFQNKDFQIDIEQFKSATSYITSFNSSTFYEEILRAFDDLLDKIKASYGDIRYMHKDVWAEWDSRVITSAADFHSRKDKVSWNLIACAIDRFNLSSFARVAQGNISCSLITEETEHLYCRRHLALLYKCNENNTIVMCNNDLNTGLGSVDRSENLYQLFSDFYKSFYRSTYLSIASLPEVCNPGGGIMHDVLPLELMRESVTRNNNCSVQNEIVIKGTSEPFGILCFKDSIEDAQNLQTKLKSLDWNLDLFEVEGENKLVCFGK